MNKRITVRAIITLIVAASIAIFALTGCGGTDKMDIARDPNGFLGYSDDFWDWYVEHN